MNAAQRRKTNRAIKRKFKVGDRVYWLGDKDEVWTIQRIGQIHAFISYGDRHGAAKYKFLEHVQ